MMHTVVRATTKPFLTEREKMMHTVVRAATKPSFFFWFFEGVVC